MENTNQKYFEFKWNIWKFFLKWINDAGKRFIVMTHTINTKRKKRVYQTWLIFTVCICLSICLFGFFCFQWWWWWWQWHLGDDHFFFFLLPGFYSFWQYFFCLCSKLCLRNRMIVFLVSIRFFFHLYRSFFIVIYWICGGFRIHSFILSPIVTKKFLTHSIFFLHVHSLVTMSKMTGLYFFCGHQHPLTQTNDQS